MKRPTVLGAALGAALLCAAPVSLHWSPAGTVFISVDKADARIGRPLTPGSVAGIHRRVHRRAYYGAAAGAAAPGSVLRPTLRLLSPSSVLLRSSRYASPNVSARFVI
jgi:hypothetical protein